LGYKYMKKPYKNCTFEELVDRFHKEDKPKKRKKIFRLMLKVDPPTVNLCPP